MIDARLRAWSMVEPFEPAFETSEIYARFRPLHLSASTLALETRGVELRAKWHPMARDARALPERVRVLTRGGKSRGRPLGSRKGALKYAGVGSADPAYKAAQKRESRAVLKPLRRAVAAMGRPRLTPDSIPVAPPRVADYEGGKGSPLYQRDRKRWSRAQARARSADAAPCPAPAMEQARISFLVDRIPARPAAQTLSQDEAAELLSIQNTLRWRAARAYSPREKLAARVALERIRQAHPREVRRRQKAAILAAQQGAPGGAGTRLRVVASAGGQKSGLILPLSTSVKEIKKEKGDYVGERGAQPAGDCGPDTAKLAAELLKVLPFSGPTARILAMRHAQLAELVAETDASPAQVRAAARFFANNCPADAMSWGLLRRPILRQLEYERVGSHLRFASELKTPLPRWTADERRAFGPRAHVEKGRNMARARWRRIPAAIRPSYSRFLAQEAQATADRLAEIKAYAAARRAAAEGLPVVIPAAAPLARPARSAPAPSVDPLAAMLAQAKARAERDAALAEVDPWSARRAG